MNKKNKKKKNNTLKQWQIILIIIILFLTIIFSSFLILTGISKKSDTESILYSYKIYNNINYKVNLYDNSFFETNYLTMNNTYIAALTKNINIVFSYNFSNSTKLDFTYTYDIVATLKGIYGTNSDNTENLVWNKQYILSNPVTEIFNQSNSINLEKNININFDFYQNIVEQFQNQLNLAIDAYLDITMTVKLTSIDNTLSNTKTLNIIIPLSSSTFKITTSYIKSKQENVYDSSYNKSNIKIFEVVFGTILLIISVLVSVIAFYYLIKVTKKSEYYLKLKKIFKNFGEIIVEVTNELDYKQMSVIDVKKFEDMIDLEEELHIPLLHYEKEKDVESWFVLINDKQLYRYILRVDKIEEITNPLNRIKNKIK